MFIAKRRCSRPDDSRQFKRIVLDLRVTGQISLTIVKWAAQRQGVGFRNREKDDSFSRAAVGFVPGATTLIVIDHPI